MNYIINNIITGLNNIGFGFWGYAVSMFIQSSVLIALLLIIDFILRKRVRAVFLYCIWMLVFVKLILPASFTLPTGVGYWLSDYWPKETVVSAVKQQPTLKQAMPVRVPVQSVVPSPEVTTAAESLPAANETIPNQFRLEALSSQAMIFTGWLVGVLVLSALVIQRVFFVRALIAQSKPAKGRLLETLEQCRRQFGIRKNVKLRLSENSISPAVCGLLKPIILMPTGLLEKLSREKLQAVLVHELAHIKRADIWVNLAQTILQVVYFYNPLVWLANMMVRRIREQAVDEMVLVTLKQGAKTYSNTLIDIGQMAFVRPNLSLRLVGVVESKKALQRRIKHMLSHPIPKTAKLGIAGLLAVIVLGCALLPMARAEKQSVESAGAILDSDKDGLENELEAELGTNPKKSDTDNDGLSDYDEYCKYRTDPTKKDSDGDGKPDGDWQERREYTYTIKAICEIRLPSDIQMINDLYQDTRPIRKKATVEDAKVVEVLIFPFATTHVYGQPYPKKSLDKQLKEYIQPTVSMNFSPEMKKEIGDIVKDAATDVEAIEKMLLWIDHETELVKYNPHWEFLNVIDDKIVWHKSVGDSQRDEQFLETNFFGDSMFKKKVHGTCSSTAILRGTMLRAAGLPTRLIQTLPLITRYSEDPEPLADRLRMRAMAKGYNWGPGNGGANHTYNEVFLNNRWVRVDNSIGTGPFVGDKLFVKAWSVASWNNLKEEWNDRRCFKALDVSDAYPKYESESTKSDIAIEDKNLIVTQQPDGRFKALIRIYNKGSIPSPEFGVYFYAGYPDKDGRLLATHAAGPIMPCGNWGEYNPHLELKTGEDTISVVVDPDNKVEESDETNNRASANIPGLSKKGAKETNKSRGRKADDTPVITVDKAQDGKSVAALLSGVTVELVGVCDYANGGKRCFRADGTPLGKEIYVEREHAEADYGFMVKVDGPNDLNFSWDIEGCARRWGSQVVLDAYGNRVAGYQAAATNGFGGRVTTNVRVGIASGPWETKFKHDGRNMMTISGNENILFSQAYESGNFVGITVSSPWRKDRAERIIVVDKDGQAHITKNIGSVASGDIDQMTAKFYDLKLKDIAEFQFQTRLYEWVTFKNVSLKPNFKTDVQIEVGKTDSDTKRTDSLPNI